MSSDDWASQNSLRITDLKNQMTTELQLEKKHKNVETFKFIEYIVEMYMVQNKQYKCVSSTLELLMILTSNDQSESNSTSKVV